MAAPRHPLVGLVCFRPHPRRFCNRWQSLCRLRRNLHFVLPDLDGYSRKDKTRFMGHIRNIALLVGLSFHFAAAQGIKPMNTPSCSLDEKGLEERKIKVLHALRDKASEVKSTEDGYVFSVPRSSENLDLAATLISLETECCPFLSFSLDAKEGQPHFTFGISASAESRGFLKEIFDLKE